MYSLTTLLVHSLGAEYSAQCPADLCVKTLEPGWLFDAANAFARGVIGSMRLDKNRGGADGRPVLSGSASGDANGPVNLSLGRAFHPEHVNGIFAT
jgi:hypothetical protein